MPHGALKLIPGIDTTKTPALNEAAMSQSNLIRFLPDRNGLGLAQKLGGWVPYYPNPIESSVRELHSWQDLNENKWLALGADSSLSVINSGNRTIITPTFKTSAVTPNFSMEAGFMLGEGTQAGNFVVTEDNKNLVVGSGSNIVTVVDPGQDILEGDTVWIRTPVAVGGGVVSGVYPVYKRVDINTYQILADFYATENTVNGGTLIVFTTTAGSPSVKVTLPSNGYQVGDTIAFLTPTNVGGLLILGEYFVITVIDADNFTINGNYAANASQTTMGSSFLIGEGSQNKNIIATEDSNPLLNNRGILIVDPQVYFYYFLNQGVYGLGSGFGRGGYGIGGYGTGATTTSTRGGLPITATDWFEANFGQYLLASPYNGPIYIWSPDSGAQTALVIPTAPMANAGIFIAMPQRQVIAWGSSFDGSPDPLMIRWSDVGNPAVWRAQAVNQAGSFRIPEGSMIVAGLQASQQAIFWTDQSVWSMQYIGPPLVYSFNKIGEGVGAISPKSVGTMNNIVYWMSPSQFNLLSNNGVQTIACPVWDVIFQNLNTDVDANGRPYTDRIRCAVNSQFGEVTWFYPTIGSTENNAYVKYNTQIQQWDYGSMSRTAWMDQSVLGAPIGAGTDPNFIYQHEMGNDAYVGNQDGPMNSSFRTGYFQVGDEGDHMIFIDQIWPDMKWGDYNQNPNATVNLTFYGVNYPGDTPTAYGPYTMTQNTQYISTRIRHRLVSIQLSSNDVGTFWRVGNVRYRFQPDGRF